MDLSRIIGGFQKQSFVDWDGRAVAVIFTKGCNFRCGFCHNPSLVLPHLMANLSDIQFSSIGEYLEKRRQWLDGVVITGGEPTIHKELPVLIERIKALGFAVKLDTNGTNPAMVKLLIAKKLVDYVAMDIKTLLEEPYYQQIARTNLPNVVELVMQTLGVLQTSGIEYQLRTTLVPRYHTEEIIKSMKAQLVDDSVVFQEYRSGGTIDEVMVIPSS